MNVIPIDAPDTLSVIFDRGLIGIYHDWCESLNTYPRTYDLLHSSFLFRDRTQRYINYFTRCPLILLTADSCGTFFKNGYVNVILAYIRGKTTFTPSNYHPICKVYLYVSIFAMFSQSNIGIGVAMSHYCDPK